MALFNYATKEITLKIVYYGPGLSGKTTNIQYLHSALNADNKGKLLSLSTESDRTLFFDFLPVELGKIKEFSIRFQLYTVPGQVRYNATRKVVLKGADAVIFVADSQRDMNYQNVESFENMRENLIANNLNPDEIPLILQYNKRDLKNILSIDELNEALNSNGLYRIVEAEAINGTGVEDSFQLITKMVLKDISRKHKIEVQPAPVKTESTRQERIVEKPDTGMRPVHSAGESPDLAFKEALKSLSEAELQRKKKLTDTFKFHEEKLPELGRRSVPSQSENEPVDSADDEFGIKLNIPSARDTEFNRDDIFPGAREAKSETRPEAMNRSEVIRHDPEADLFESTAYDEAADLPDDAVIEIDEELGIPELEPDTEDPIVAEAVQSDTETEMFQSADFDLEDAVELDDDDGLGLDKELEELADVKNSDPEVKVSDYAFEAETVTRRSLSGMRENQRSESAIMSDESFRMISDDLLVLKNLFSEMKSMVSSLQNEIQAMKNDLTSENLEDIKKEQKVMTSSMQDIVSLINELKTRKSWFRF